MIRKLKGKIKISSIVFIILIILVNIYYIIDIVKFTEQFGFSIIFLSVIDFLFSVGMYILYHFYKDESPIARKAESSNSAYT